MIDLAKQYDSEDIERYLLEKWCRSNNFAPAFDTSKKKFSMVIPPPNVTGFLHMGHALNVILQDILARFKRLMGFDVLWLLGVDHAGIATQFVVERALIGRKMDPKSLSKKELLKEIEAYKDTHGCQIFSQLKRMGASLNFLKTRFTLDEGFVKAVKKAFKDLFKDGLIYRGNYITNYCIRCQTALSDLEVSHDKKSGKLWSIKYFFKDHSFKFLIITTTRPETMLGDMALAVHPEDPRYKHDIGKTVIVPLVNREVRVVADSFVDMKFGSGVVKITPSHDFADFEVARRHNLPLMNILDKRGIVVQEGPYKGLERFKAREKVVEDLEKLDLIDKVEHYEVPAGKCYRCSSVVEPFVSRQWFVKMRPLSRLAIDAVKDRRIKLVPENWTKTYFDWMENIKDWCISRQIVWGHTIEALVCPLCDYAALKDDGNVGDICPKCFDGKLEEETDVLDTWFSSALWPFVTLGWPLETKELSLFYPTSTLVTSFDILFFWVARMIMMGFRFTGDVPFKDVYIHALIRDEQGQKMSKSRGNVIDPVDTMECYGTDALRFTLATLAVQGRDIRLSESRIQGYRTFMNKIWNVSRFAFSKVDSHEEIRGLFNELPTPKNIADHWILSRAKSTLERVSVYLDCYQFSDAANTLYHFVWHELCDWYVEFSKVPLGKHKESFSCKSTKHTLLYTISLSLKLMHPFIPFITEYLYCLAVNDEDALLSAVLPDPKDMLFDPIVSKNCDHIIEIIELTRTLRGEHSIAPSVLTDLYVVCNDALVSETVMSMKESIEILAKSKLKGVFGSFETNEVLLKSSNGVFDIFLKPLTLGINVEGEKGRLHNEVAKIDAEIMSVQEKLKNENFLEKAPVKVVQMYFDRLKTLETKKKAALGHLKFLQNDA